MAIHCAAAERGVLIKKERKKFIGDLKSARDMYNAGQVVD